jgi:hypothetical protein
MRHMLKTALEFAPNTSENSKKLVLGMFSPGELLLAYRQAKAACGSSDVVLHTSVEERAIRGGARRVFCERLQQLFGPRAFEFAMWGQTAQSVVKMPLDAEAFWLVIEIPKEMPSMIVLFAMPYEEVPMNSGELVEQFS